MCRRCCCCYCCRCRRALTRHILDKLPIFQLNIYEEKGYKLKTVLHSVIFIIIIYTEHAFSHRHTHIRSLPVSLTKVLTVFTVHTVYWFISHFCSTFFFVHCKLCSCHCSHHTTKSAQPFSGYGSMQLRRLIINHKKKRF